MGVGSACLKTVSRKTETPLVEEAPCNYEFIGLHYCCEDYFRYFNIKAIGCCGGGEVICWFCYYGYAYIAIRRKPMKDLPAKHLNPKIKRVWRINDALWLTIVFLLVFVPFAIAAAVEPAGWMFITLGATAVAYGVCLVIWLVILPPIRFVRWRYEVSEDYLDIARGIIWRKRFVIPFVRVQNTDTRQGPILRAFGLASVTVSTAAGEHEIPGLDIETAEELRDRAAELARLAQEDV